MTLPSALASREPWSKLFAVQSPWVYILRGTQREADILIHALGRERTPATCGLRVLRGEHCHTSQDLFHEFAAALQFPSYFGNNWDAFDEMITDLSWLPSSAYLPVITSAGEVLRHDPFRLPTFLHMLADAARFRQTPQTQCSAASAARVRPATPFKIIFQLDRPDEAAFTRRLATHDLHPISLPPAHADPTGEPSTDFPPPLVYAPVPFRWRGATYWLLRGITLSNQVMTSQREALLAFVTPEAIDAWASDRQIQLVRHPWPLVDLDVAARWASEPALPLDQAEALALAWMLLAEVTLSLDCVADDLSYGAPYHLLLLSLTNVSVLAGGTPLPVSIAPDDLAQLKHALLAGIQTFSAALRVVSV